MAALGETGSIPQFYSGREVFITGATGFMGKVLVERLLSTCPDISRLFLLMRTKRDLGPEQRLNQLKESQVFETLRQSDPGQLEKLCIVPGDISHPGLGISQESLQDLQEVSVVFHSAATVKFDEKLKKAVEQNVLSVTRLLDICDRLPHMQAFVHVSTAYSNAELTVVEERVYPPPVTLQRLLNLVDEDSAELDDCERYIFPKPNTYTFTKAMAESAVQQHGNRGYPVAIFRPTIVISSIRHPFPGWIENLNGPSGVVAAIGKGMLHVFRCRGSAEADMLPVDMAIDTLIAVAWETAIDKPSTARVYNCSVSENPTTWEDLRQALQVYTRETPQTNLIWYPFVSVVENRFGYRISELILQTIPLYLAEYTSRILGLKKRFSLIIASQRLRAMNNALQYFTLREWVFRNGNVRRLRERLSPDDRRLYNLDPRTIRWEEHYGNFVKGIKLYLLKEKEKDLPTAKRHLYRMYFLHCTMSMVLPVVLFRMLVNKKHRQDMLRLIKYTLSLLSAYCTRATEHLMYLFHISKMYLHRALYLDLNKILFS